VTAGKIVKLPINNMLNIPFLDDRVNRCNVHIISLKDTERKVSDNISSAIITS